MKIKAGVNFHNRFDVVKNGEWVGYAENIILNQMYNRICNFSTYFNNIHFGTGSGTPTPDRTSLFSHLGTKTAEVEETIKAFPTSKVTKKIVLMPEEHVEKTITEVGVAYGSTESNLVTHAMLKDAEGNPLSINKTDIDVIEIYSTVFVTLLESQNLYWSTSGNSSYSDLIKYLVGGASFPTPYIMTALSPHFPDSKIPVGYVVSTNTATRTADVSNKKVTFTARVGINSGNIVNQTDDFSLFGVCRYKPTITHQLEDYYVGSGDGQTTSFDCIPNISNAVVKVEGVVDPTAVVVGNVNKTGKLSILHYAEEAYGATKPKMFSLVDDFERSPGGLSWKNGISINGKKFKLTFRGSTTVRYTTFILSSSVDGETWVERMNVSRNSGSVGEYSLDVEWDDLYYKFDFGGAGSVSQADTRFWLEDPQAMLPKVTLQTPPEEGEIVTVSGIVPYYPKDENYVVDVTFELIFGEGV